MNGIEEIESYGGIVKRGRKSGLLKLHDVIRKTQKVVERAESGQLTLYRNKNYRTLVRWNPVHDCPSSIKIVPAGGSKCRTYILDTPMKCMACKMCYMASSQDAGTYKEFFCSLKCQENAERAVFELVEQHEGISIDEFLQRVSKKVDNK